MVDSLLACDMRSENDKIELKWVKEAYDTQEGGEETRRVVVRAKGIRDSLESFEPKTHTNKILSRRDLDDLETFTGRVLVKHHLKLQKVRHHKMMPRVQASKGKIDILKKCVWLHWPLRFASSYRSFQKTLFIYFLQPIFFILFNHYYIITN